MPRGPTGGSSRSASGSPAHLPPTAPTAPCSRQPSGWPSRPAVVELDGADGPVVIGDLMIRREDAWAQSEVVDRARGRRVELGWVLDPRYSGHGYATEAVRELLRYCFVDLGVRRVVASCFFDSTASWRLMERVGMRRETHAVRDALHRSGRWLDSLEYAVLAEEWTAVSD